MFEGYLKIPLARLQARRPFARAVFLGMPRNGKLLRLVAPDGELSDEALQRITKDGAREVFVLPEPGADANPETLSLYRDAGAATAPALTLVAPPPSPASGPSVAGPELQAATPAPGEDPAGTILSHPPLVPETGAFLPARPEEEAAASQAAGGPAEAEPARAFDAAAGEPEPERVFSPDSAAAETEQGFSGDIGSVEPAEAFAADAGQAAVKKKVAGATDEGEPVRRFSAEKPEKIGAFRVKPLAGQKEESLRLKAAGAPGPQAAESLEPEENAGPRHETAPRGAFGATARAERAARGSGDETAPEFGDIGGEAEGETETALPAGAPSAEEVQAIGQDLAAKIQRFRAAAEASGQELLTRLGSKLDSAGEAFEIFTGTPGAHQDPALPGLARTLEDCVSDFEAMSQREELAAVIAASPGLRDALALAKTAVQKTIHPTGDLASIGGSAPDASAERWSVKNARPPDGTPSSTSLASRNLRDTPQVAGRLAAFLGFYLGYSSPDFLSELALSAMVRFSVRAGATLRDEPLPPLCRAALAPAAPEAEGVVEDSLWVLDFLEEYFRNPDCDRTRKEFSPGVFESTLKAFENSSRGPDALISMRWRQFVGRAPTITAVSASSKASSRATKAAKNLVSEIPLGT